jgi:proteasome accessory factor B
MVSIGDDDANERLQAKRDRTARLIRVVHILRQFGEQGATPDDIARQTAMSRRTVYRDLKVIEDELGIPVWSVDGRWGVEGGAFLPPLRLTEHEAMAVVLSARLMTRYADKYDPNLAAAFQKLESGLPEALREHVERAVAVLSERAVDPAFNRRLAELTRAWSERRVVTFRYRPATYEGQEREPRDARVRPYLLQPSLQTHALYLMGFDEIRGAMRTFKVERIDDLALTGERFEPPDPGDLEAALRRAWDIIGDQGEITVVLRFAPAVSARVREATWHPTQVVAKEPDGSLRWTANVAGMVEIRLWILGWGDEVEVLEPPELRDDVAGRLRRALALYEDR